MKILLTVPPFREEGLEMSSKESIGVCYLTAMLREHGFQVDILDADLLKLSEEETVNRICRQRYDLIGFSLLEGTIESTVDIVAGLREQGVDAHIVLGGYFPSLVTEEILNELGGVDSVIMGEGEHILLKLARRLAHGKDWRDLEGIAYGRGGEVVINPVSSLFDIDDVPFPVRDLLPEVLLRGGVAGLVASRGCFANCSFCCVNSLNHIPNTPGWRGRAVERVVDEMQALVDDWGVDAVSFYDSNFIGPGQAGITRTYELAEEIMRRGLEIDFAICARPDQIDEDLFLTLKKAGMTEVFIGIESMSQPSLDLYQKRITVEENMNAVETLEKLQIFYRPGFILYEPYITLNQIRDNISFLRTLLDHRYCTKHHFFKGLRVYRGSPLEGRLQGEGILSRNGWHNTYRWQDESVVKFIHLAGQIGAKMLPLVDRAKRLDQANRRSLDRLLGAWSLKVYEDILCLLESDKGGSDDFIKLSLEAEQKLARIEGKLNLPNRQTEMELGGIRYG
jgi:hypothetical protein